MSIKSAHKCSLGGVIKFKGHIFNKINGFRNDIFGWGIEDRDLYYRCKFNNINIIRNNSYSFKIMDHKHCGNQFNKKKSIKVNNIFSSKDNNKIKKFIDESGLNNLKYKIIKEEKINEYCKKIIVEI